MKKIAIIIPGFGFSGKEKQYKKIAEVFRGLRVETIVVNIQWKHRAFSDYLKQFDDECEKYFKKGNSVHVLGFSFGAMMALDISSKYNVNRLMLCSLSPYFKEDLPKIKQWWKDWLGKKRLEEFQELSFVDLAKKVNSKTFILAGNKEGVEVERRAKDAHEKIASSDLLFLEGVKHDISDVRYFNAIKKIIISDWK